MFHELHSLISTTDGRAPRDEQFSSGAFCTGENEETSLSAAMTLLPEPASITVSPHKQRVAESRHNDPPQSADTMFVNAKKSVSERLRLVAEPEKRERCDDASVAALKKQLKMSVERERMHMKRITMLEGSTDWKNREDANRYNNLLQSPADSYSY